MHEALDKALLKSQMDVTDATLETHAGNVDHEKSAEPPGTTRLLDARDSLWDSSQKYICLSDKRTIEPVQTITCAHIPACADLHRGVYDPDLRLPGTVGNGLEPGQKHIL